MKIRCKGSVRAIVPLVRKVDHDKVNGLAQLMTWKTALVNFHNGGAKGGIGRLYPPKDFGLRELERLTWIFPRRIHDLIRVQTDVPAPDMGINAQERTGLGRQRDARYLSSWRQERTSLRRQIDERYLPSWNFLHWTTSRRFTTLTVACLIVTNVLVYQMWKVAGNNFMFRNFTVHLDYIICGQFHTIVTHAFSHRHGTHLIWNMAMLSLWGMQLNSAGLLLKMYFIGGISGTMFILLHQTYLTIFVKDRSLLIFRPAHGASAAVYSMMVLDLLSWPTCSVFFWLPSKALGMYLVWEDVNKLVKGNKDLSNIDLSATGHLGGAVVGVVAWTGMMRIGCF